MDTVKHVEPKFWHYFKSQIRGEYPHICLIGEVLFENKEDLSQLLQYQNYHDFDSIFDFPLCTALRSTLIYDESLSYWVARPRLNDGEPLGCLTMTTRSRWIPQRQQARHPGQSHVDLVWNMLSWSFASLNLIRSNQLRLQQIISIKISY